MRKLSTERKRYLLHQNRQLKNASVSSLTWSKAGTPPKQVTQYAASYGPSSGGQLLSKQAATSPDTGFFKKFSISSWTSSRPTTPVQAPEPVRSSREFNDGSVRRISRPDLEDVEPLQPQNTGSSMWSGWWASSGGEKRPKLTEKPNGTEERGQAWYVDGIRTGKPSEMKTAKHLISLRVQLSTAKLSWIEDFVDDHHGLDALAASLAGLVAKGGKRKQLSEIEETVVLETVKCLRVLLNTQACLVELDCEYSIAHQLTSSLAGV